jgi:hypothetical protein
MIRMYHGVRRAILVIAIHLAFNATTHASYTFVNIADTTTTAPSGTFTSFRLGGSVSANPSLSSGTVTFFATYDDGTNSGIFQSNGSGITTIAKKGDLGPNGTFTGFGYLSSQLDQNAFIGFDGVESVLIADGSTLKSIAKTGGPAPIGTFGSFGINGGVAQQNVSTYSLPDSHTTAFVGRYSTFVGIFLGSGGPLTPIIKEGDPAPTGTFGEPYSPSLSAVIGPGGTPVPIVAFRAPYNGGGEGIFTKVGATLTTIMPAFYPGVAMLGDPVVLHNDVAFTGAQFPSAESIYWYTGGQLVRAIAADDAAPVGKFHNFGDPVLTASGMAFEANYNFFETGIFTKQSPAAPPTALIKTGDTLFGGVVEEVRMGHFGGRTSIQGPNATGIGDFAIYYRLTDNRNGIALILATPEPTIVSYAAVLLIAFCMRRIRG